MPTQHFPQFDPTEALRREYGGLVLRDLRKRAKAASIPADQLEEAMDADDPEEELISYLVQQHAAEEEARGAEAALAVRAGLKIKIAPKQSDAPQLTGSGHQAPARGISPASMPSNALPG